MTFTNHTNGLAGRVLGVAIGSTIYAATPNGLRISTNDGANFVDKGQGLRVVGIRAEQRCRHPPSTRAPTA